MPDVFYAGTAAPTILHRAKLGDPITTLDKYPGGGVRRLVMDPQNFRNLYVVDNSNKVWASFDEGATWSDITANLPMLSPDLRCIEIFSPNIMIENTVLIVGGLRGVWQMRNPGSGSSWSPLSTGLPNALFNDLHYNYAPGPDGVIDDVLVAGSLGRGTWTITNYFRQGGAGLPRLAQAPAQQPRSADVFSASRMLTVRPMPPVAVPPAEP